MRLTVETVKRQGEYLGFCPIKGYIYSVFRGYDEKGNKKYTVVALYDGDIYPLISFTGIL